MSHGIFLIHSHDQLVEMREQPYDSEDLLQRLLARYPNLLAGDQIDRETPRRWLLVRREAAVPDRLGGTARWSLDHLFLDQDAIPTLVEVKRSTDTRIRREVVGQMLDYAANAIRYWPIEQLRSDCEMLCRERGSDVEQEIAALIGPEKSVEKFWQDVSVNLQAGRIRMVFVADSIPQELRSVIEFLNRQMSPAEVLGVEVRQYTAEGFQTLVPTVYGQTAEVQQRKAGGQRQGRQWDEGTYFAAMTEQCGAVVAGVARSILDWATPRTTYIWWGRGERAGSFVPVLELGSTKHALFAVWTSGTVEIYFQWYATKAPFQDTARRRAILDQLNAIPGVSLPETVLERRPGIALETLAQGENLERFLAVFEGVVEAIETR